MDKLQSLREYMKTQSLAALLIPHTDEFQSEYIASHSQRLAWLTGFSGSAGIAVITQKKAAFFTDGRYTFQAKEELPSFYEKYNTSQKTPSQWVLKNLSKNDRIGYDPWLFTEAQLEKYEGSLVALTSNPIDQFWVGRPAVSHDPIHLHPLKYAGEESSSKRTRITTTLKADQLLLTSCDSIAWLLNIRGNDVPYTPIVHCICLLRRNGTYDLFVDLKKVKGEVLKTLQEEGGQLIDLSQILSYLERMSGSCQMDPQTTPMSLVQSLLKAGVKIVRESDPCLLPKAIKNEVELQGMRETHLLDGLALHRFFEWLKMQPLKGETTELSATKKVYEFRKKSPLFRGLSFETISGFGPHGAIIHYGVTPNSDIPLKREGLYLLDSGGQYLTGTTDVTRTIALGIPTAEQKDRYTRALKGHIALAQAIFPDGTTGMQLDSLARQFLWQVGCDYEHGTGHGVGSYLSVHEGPQGISKSFSNVPLKPGMILSNEPGYYKEGEYGIRIESLIEVINSPHLPGFYGFETLTLCVLDPNLIDETLLTNQEKTWIENYHERIRTALSPYLS